MNTPTNPSDDKPKPAVLKMVCASTYLPKDDARKPVGEDAHFICVDQQVIGVADGVGGWARLGVDSGEYARELMFNSSIAVLRRFSSEPPIEADPKSILEEAFSATSVPVGSSTACILSLGGGGVLRAANVGDSGFMVFRDCGLIYRSPTQQKSFNHPFQLGNSDKSDRPDCADELSVDVSEGDVIVLGTDGLLDNLFAEQVEMILAGVRSASASAENNIGLLGLVDGDDLLQHLANSIAYNALCISLNRDGVSPFSIAADQAGKARVGGKIDDITIIVAKIVSSSITA